MLALPFEKMNFLVSRYGWTFLFETYLYHVVRQDNRHNFSPYFYLIYLTNITWQNSVILKLFYFLPQLVSVLVASCALYQHIELCFFVLTVLFVSFNKVCTSQVILFRTRILKATWNCQLFLSIQNVFIIKNSLHELTLYVRSQFFFLNFKFCQYQGKNISMLIYVNFTDGQTDKHQKYS